MSGVDYPPAATLVNKGPIGYMGNMGVLLRLRDAQCRLVSCAVITVVLLDLFRFAVRAGSAKTYVCQISADESGVVSEDRDVMSEQELV